MSRKMSLTKILRLLSITRSAAIPNLTLVGRTESGVDFWSTIQNTCFKGQLPYCLKGLGRCEILDRLLQLPVGVEATPHSSRPDLPR